jgi:ATP-dependent RNA helicase RhlE
MPFKKIGLLDPLVRGILATGFTAPTEIQSQVIPAAIAGSDIIGCAQTGTGKTAAFALPILNRLCHEHPGKRKNVKALIITPTRELAGQIEKEIMSYGRYLNLRTLAVYGGVNIKGQLNALRKGVDIVVSTPGRLMDHIQRRTIDLHSIEVLVIDEADRMFDMGFINDVRKIVSYLPHKRQTMLFSATISREVKTLAAGILKSPKEIQIGRERNPIETITQHIYPVQREQKMALLLHMLKNQNMYCVLIFCRTKHGVDKINRQLKKAEIVSVSIHSDRSQSQRENAMDGFKRGKFQVMVATDIAARGIDVEGISHVVNYDVPTFAEDYIHRIGRTGRASATGDAITFVSHDEEKYLRQIERFIERKFVPERIAGFDYNASVPQQVRGGEKSHPSHQSGKDSSAGYKSNHSHGRPWKRFRRQK